MSNFAAQRRQSIASLKTGSVLSGALSAAFVIAGYRNAYATGTDQHVVEGSITTTQVDANHTRYDQSTNRAVVNYSSYNVLTGTWDEYVLPSSSGNTLVRVLGTDATRIDGKLTSNGHLTIVNGSGVFFSGGAKVDVAGMVVSTADISNSNFMKSNMKFDVAGKADARIVNDGVITAQDGGLVALIGPNVVNNGIIQANMGTVAIGAAQTATLDLYGDNLYSFTLGKAVDTASTDANGNVIKNAIDNQGTIQAGKVLLSAKVAKAVVDNAINTDGIIEASNAHTVGGTIVLDGGDEGAVRIAGKINAKGKTVGGNVTVAGRQVNILPAATINASAENGKGGNVKINSTDSTVFQGAIDVGSANGDGGNAEVSSANDLTYDGFTNAIGVNGEMGTLLLDPGNWTISLLNNSANNIKASTLISQLNSANVTIDTTSAAAHAGQQGDISVLADVNWSGKGSLSLVAEHDILVTAGINASYNGNAHQGAITMQAGNDINAAAMHISTNSGDIKLNATHDITLNNLSLFGSTELTSTNGDIDLTAGHDFSVLSSLLGTSKIETTNGNMTLEATNGALNLSSHYRPNGVSVIADNGNVKLTGKSLDVSNAHAEAGNKLVANISGDVMLKNGGYLEADNGNLNVNQTGIFTGDVGSLRNASSAGSVSVNQNVGGSIQNAINALGFVGNGGAFVNLGNGTFVEHVDINRDLTLSGNGASNTTIQAPNGTDVNFSENGIDHSAIVYVHDTGNAKIKNLTVDGNHQASDNATFDGIAYIDAGGVVDGVHVTNINTGGASTSKQGNGIYANHTADNYFTQFVTPAIITITPIHIPPFDLTVKNSTIDNFQNDGILAEGEQLNVHIKNNDIEGNGQMLGFISFIPEKMYDTNTGIVLNGVSDSDIIGNTINQVATGVELNNGSNLAVSDNTITNVVDGIDGTNIHHSSIDHNMITAAEFIGEISLNASNHPFSMVGGDNGIILFNSDDVKIDHNEINNFMNGVGAFSSSNLHINHNTIDTAEAAVILNDVTNSEVNNNAITNVDYGVYVFGTNEFDSADGHFGNQYLTINNNTIDQANYGIYADNVEHLTIQGNDITAKPAKTVFFPILGEGNEIPFDGPVITTNVGIWVAEGNYGDVGNNKVSGFDTGIQLGLAGATDHADSFTVHNNKVKNFTTGVEVVNTYNDVIDSNSLIGGTTGIDILDSHDIHADLNDINGSQTGINAVNSNSLYLTQNEIRNATTGINLNNVYTSKILLNDIKKADTGINIEGGYDHMVYGNNIDKVNYGVVADNTSSLTIDNNIIHGGYGTYIDSPSDGIIFEAISTTEGPGTNGIVIKNSGFSTVENNDVYNFSNADVKLNNDGFITVNNNDLHKATYGVEVKNSAFISVDDNKIHNVTTGVDLFKTVLAEVNSNKIDNVTTGVNVVKGSDISVDHNKIANASVGVNVEESKYINVDHNKISDVEYGVKFHNVRHSEANHNTITNAFAGIYIDGTNEYDSANMKFGNRHIDVNGNDIENVTYGIYADNVYKINIKNNTIENFGSEEGGATGDHGIWVVEGNQGDIKNNFVSGFDTGIQLGNTAGRDQADGFNVQFNEIFNSGTNAVAIVDTYNDTIESNIISDAQNGVYIIGSHDIHVDLNDISNTGTGVNAQESNNIFVTQNAIHDSDTGINFFDVVTGKILVNTLTNLFTGVNIDGSEVASDGGTPTPISHDIIVYGNDIEHVNYGVLANNTTDLTISGNTIVGGYASESPSDGIVFNDTIEGPGVDGIKVTNSSGVTIDSNNVSNFSDADITINGSNNVLMTNNTLHNAFYGIKVADSNDFTADSNDIYNIFSGVDIGSSFNGRLSHNTIEGPFVGVNVNDSHDIHIESNLIDDTFVGVGVADSDHVYVAGNTITNSFLAVDFNNVSNSAIIVNNLSNDYAGINIDGDFTEGESESLGQPLSHDIMVYGNDIENVEYGVVANHTDALTIDQNTVHGGYFTSEGEGEGEEFILPGNTGISVSNSSNVEISSNDVSNFETGILVSNSNGTMLNTNNVHDNSTGTHLLNSNSVTITGDTYTNNFLSVDLDGSSNTFLDSLNIQNSLGGTGIDIHNASGGNLLKDVIINGGHVAVIVDGAGSDMQFSGIGSDFSNVDLYFTVQNGAMFGSVLDASGQSFDHIRASDFTEAQLAAAEGITTDQQDDATLGDVFYKAFPTIPPVTPPGGTPTPAGAPLDISALNRFQQIEGTPLESLFSVAGHTITNNGSEIPLTFQPLAVQLSLLAPSAGNAASGNLGDLSPSAGGDGSNLGSLEPSAGITPNCANSFLSSETGNFDRATCEVNPTL